MKAVMKNGTIVTGRLAEILVSRKVAIWLDEDQVIDEVIEANDEPDQVPTAIKAKVSLDKKADKNKKKAGRPPKK